MAEEGNLRTLRLSDVWALLRQRWPVVSACCGVGAGLAILASLLATPLYESTTLLYLSPVAGQEMKVDRVVDNDAYQAHHRRVYIQTQLRVLQSRPLLEEVLRRFEDLGHTSFSADADGIVELSDAMAATPEQGTELLAITVRTPDRNQSAVLANLIAEVYQRHTLDTHQGAALSAREWIVEQLGGWEERIDEVNQERVDFQEAHGVATTSSELTALNARIAALNLSFGEVSTERVILQTRLEGHEHLLAAGRYEELANDLGTPLLVGLSDSHASAALSAAQLGTRYGERHPSRVDVEARLGAIKAEMSREVERAISGERVELALVEQREATILEEIAEADRQSLQVEKLRAEFDRLNSRLARADEFHTALSRRVGEVELQSETQLSYLRVVEPAIPSREPASPTTLLNAFGGGFLGFVVGLCAALAREFLDDTVRTSLDVSMHLGVPFLGLVPQVALTEDSPESALYTLTHPNSLMAEAVRGIRTVLDLDPAGADLRRLLVTSAVSSEGKTTAVVLLGIAYASLGRRVLLVDGDLRKPRLHKVFGAALEGGLSSYIEGASLSEVAVSTQVRGLDLLPAGRSGSLPTELLAASQTSRLLERLNDAYDLVLIDTPPSSLLSDARVLSAQVDGVIVVVRQLTASRRAIRDTIAGVQRVGGQVLGVIINDVDLAGRGGSADYGYGYGYGYGDGATEEVHAAG